MHKSFPKENPARSRATPFAQATGLVAVGAALAAGLLLLLGSVVLAVRIARRKP
jgi:hypothetical protein